MQCRYIRRREVENLTGLSRSSIYAMMKVGTFPRPVKLSARAVAWSEEDILTWLSERPVA